jgi:glutamate transport system substrate-binding protein
MAGGNPTVNPNLSRPAMGGRGRRLPVIRLILFAALMTLALVLGVALLDTRLLDPTENELREQAGLTGKRELLVGVIDGRPGLSERSSDGGAYVGFDIDIAYLVTADLGFRPSEVKFLPLESEDRARMQARDAGGDYVRVDLVVATFSITDEREERSDVSFSEPYLITEQSVVTRKDHDEVDELPDLQGESVCTISTATSSGPAEKAGVKLHARQLINECVDGLLDGEFDAVTTDAAILAGFVERHADRIKQHDIGLADNESWGINTGGNEPLRTLVNLALYRSFNDPDDRRWETAFDKHLRPLQAANHPQQVAQSTQPALDQPKVRQMPWEG